MGLQAARREAAWLLWQSLGYMWRVLRTEMDPLLHEVGMGSPVDVWVCKLLAETPEPQRLSDLCRSLRLPASTLSDVTDRLVGEGLLRREPHPSDRRSTVLALTDRARAAMDEVFAGAARRLDGMLAELDDATLEHLTVGLRALGGALEAAGGPPAPTLDRP